MWETLVVVFFFCCCWVWHPREGQFFVFGLEAGIFCHKNTQKGVLSFLLQNLTFETACWVSSGTLYIHFYPWYSGWKFVPLSAYVQAKLLLEVQETSISCLKGEVVEFEEEAVKTFVSTSQSFSLGTWHLGKQAISPAFTPAVHERSQRMYLLCRLPVMSSERIVFLRSGSGRVQKGHQGLTLFCLQVEKRRERER